MLFYAASESTWRSQCGRYLIRSHTLPGEAHRHKFTIAVDDRPLQHTADRLTDACSWCTDREGRKPLTFAQQLAQPIQPGHHA
jgi:hypothetical protein